MDKKRNNRILSELDVLVTIPVKNVSNLNSHIKLLQDRKFTFALLSDKNNKVFLTRKSRKEDPKEIINTDSLANNTVIDFYHRGKLVV